MQGFLYQFYQYKNSAQLYFTAFIITPTMVNYLSLAFYKTYVFACEKVFC